MTWSWLILVAAMAGCYAPENPSTAHDAEASAPSPLQLLEASKQRLATGDAQGALEELVYAAELAETADDACPFAESTSDFAEQAVERELHAQARVAYAIAIRFAEGCPSLDREQLRLRQGQAESQMRAAQLTSP